MTTDAELLRRYATEASEEAFREFVHRHVDFVYAAALRHVGNSHRAEDIVQSVFIDLARKAGPLSARNELVGWLYTSTRHAAKRLVRAETRREARERAAQFMLDNSSEPAAEWDRVGPLIDGILATLSERDRAAILLRFFKQQSFAEVGAALGLSQDSARKRVERSLDKIRSRLARSGIASTTLALAGGLSAQASVGAPAGLAASACAAAATSGAFSSGITLIQLMSAYKMTTGIAAAAILLLCGGVIDQGIAARRAQTELASAESADVAAALHLTGLRERLNQNSDKRERTQGTQGAAESASSADEISGASTRPRDLASERAKALMATHPKVRQAFFDYANAKVAMDVLEFEKAHNLTPAQTSQLESLALPGSTWQFDVAGQLYTFSTGSEDLPTPAFEAQVRSLLGESAVGDLEQYAATFQTRSLAGEMAAAANADWNPLSSAQVQQLEQIFAESGGGSSQGREIQVAALDWSAARTRAQEMLTPAQLQAFDAVHQEVVFNLALSESGDR